MPEDALLQLGETEVENLRAPALVDHDVVGLEVAMDDLARCPPRFENLPSLGANIRARGASITIVTEFKQPSWQKLGKLPSMNRFHLLSAATLVLSFMTASLDAQVEITYLGNEGVLLRSGNSAVLIDALHAPYKDYATAPAEVRSQLVQGTRPYHDVDLVLVSHVHGDHFDPAMVAAHLAKNRKAQLISSDHVISAVSAELGASSAGKRMRSNTPDPGATTEARVGDIKVSFLGLPHDGDRPWSEFRNLGHIIEIGGLKVLHVGDAKMDADVFRKFRLPERKIDVALLPHWYLGSPTGQKLIRELIQPRRMFAVHVQDATAEEAGRKVLAAFPEAVVFTKIGSRTSIMP